MKTRILFIVVIAFTLFMFTLFMGSCEKDRVENANAIVINTSMFPSGTELLVSLVPSEYAGEAFPLEVEINERAVINLSSKQKNLLKLDAYLSIILFDDKGEYLTQNFFPFVAGEQILTLTEE